MAYRRRGPAHHLSDGPPAALTAAIAAGVFALITPDIWRLADVFGSVRLSLVAVGSVAATAATVVIGVLSL